MIERKWKEKTISGEQDNMRNLNGNYETTIS